MKLTLIIAFFLFAFSATANRLNMQGSSTVSLSGGSYTYTVNLNYVGGTLAPGSQWSVTQNGQLIAVFPADDTATGTAEISLPGSAFGSPGTAIIYLIGIDDFGAIIYGNKSVTVTP